MPVRDTRGDGILLTAEDRKIEQQNDRDVERLPAAKPFKEGRLGVVFGNLHFGGFRFGLGDKAKSVEGAINEPIEVGHIDGVGVLTRFAVFAHINSDADTIEWRVIYVPNSLEAASVVERHIPALIEAAKDLGPLIVENRVSN